MKSLNAIILGLLLLLPMAATAGPPDQDDEILQQRISQLDQNIERARRNLEHKRTELSRLKSRQALVRSLDTELSPLLDKLREELLLAMQSGLPFLPEERAVRLEAINTLLADPDAAPEDKIGRMLEALTIEARYGQDIEIRSETIPTGQSELRGCTLRLGRIAVFFLTPDGNQAYRLEQDGTWSLLPDPGPKTLARALRMRDRSEPFELLHLPVEVQQ